MPWRGRRAPASRGWSSSTRRTAAGRLPWRPRAVAGEVRLGVRAARAPLGEAGASTALPTCSPRRARVRDRGTHHSEPLPGRVVEEEHRLHDEVVEEIVSGDDEQLERYLSGDVPPPPSSSARSPTRCSTGTSSRCSCGSATTGVGVDRLADFICELGPSPADRPTGHSRRRCGVEVEVDRRPRQAARLRVQDHRRPVRRPGLGVQGAVRQDRRRRPAGQHRERRRGADARPVPRARQGAGADEPVVAGDIAAVAKLSDTATWSTLAPKDTPVRVAGPVSRRRCSAWRSCRSRRPTTTSCRAPSSGCSRRIRRSPSTATRRPARRCCAASATPTWPWRSSGWPASSASTSRPRTSACRTARRSPARPRRRAR